MAIHFENKFTLALANQWVERLFHNGEYCVEKIKKASQMDVLVAMLEFYNLDQKGRQNFAGHLGLTGDDLESCAFILRKVIN